MLNTESEQLKQIIEIYEKDLQPFRFTYRCDFGTNISFVIDPDKVCHLIFGTIDKTMRNNSQFKGQLGFDNIKNEIITELPYQLKKNFKNKGQAFTVLRTVLEKPEAIYFNRNLVTSNDIPTRIDANFLLYKKIKNIDPHLFLTKSDIEDALVPISLCKNTKDTYRRNQIKLKIIDIKIEPR